MRTLVCLALLRSEDNLEVVVRPEFDSVGKRFTRCQPNGSVNIVHDECPQIADFSLRPVPTPPPFPCTLTVASEKLHGEAVVTETKPPKNPSAWNSAERNRIVLTGMVRCNGRQHLYIVGKLPDRRQDLIIKSSVNELEIYG